VHKRFFQEINTGALNSTFIAYHASRSLYVTSSYHAVVEMKEQIKGTPQLYYEYVALNKEAPGDIDLTKIKFINLIPTQPC